MDQRPAMPPSAPTGGEVPRTAFCLGWLGVLPFVVLAVADIASPGRFGEVAAGWLVLYGAVILSFLGGCHWGMAMGKGAPAPERLMVSVVPALVAWPAAIAGGTVGALILAFAFIVWLAVDLKATREGWMPEWWPRLRSPVSALVAASLVISALA